MSADPIFRRYQELQAYVNWTDDDAARIRAVADRLEPHLPALIEDFYAEIERHEETRRVLTGGPAQINRLKGTLLDWLRGLLSGNYDAAYVAGRWRVGRRHVEIGLPQVYTNAALSRLRAGLVRALKASWSGDPEGLQAVIGSLHMLVDLDLAIIEDSYQTEHVQRLQRTERLAALGQVAGGVAHELRNPLNVIKTSAFYLLNARNPAPEKRVEHLERIERHVELADSVITALSNFARIPVPNLKPIAVSQAVTEAIEADPPGDTIAVVVDLPAKLPPVLADLDQLRIVFGNLLRNARDAMPRGGTLTIRAMASDSTVEVAVADTGVGIPPEHLSRILEPLYSTKTRGLGLGLAIARSILEKGGGSLAVTSQVGVGSAFAVRLPAAVPGREPDATG